VDLTSSYATVGQLIASAALPATHLLTSGGGCLPIDGVGNVCCYAGKLGGELNSFFMARSSPDRADILGPMPKLVF